MEAPRAELFRVSRECPAVCPSGCLALLLHPAALRQPARLFLRNLEHYLGSGPCRRRQAQRRLPLHQRVDFETETSFDQKVYRDCDSFSHSCSASGNSAPPTNKSASACLFNKIEVQ